MKPEYLLIFLMRWVSLMGVVVAAGSVIKDRDNWWFPLLAVAFAAIGMMLADDIREDMK